MAEANGKHSSPTGADSITKSSTGRIIKRKKFDDDEDNDGNPKEKERDVKEQKEYEKKEKGKKKRKAAAIQEEIDFSKWTSQDDLLLKEAVLNVEAFDQISKTVKFSNKFSPYQLEARWRALMYDPAIAGEAAKAMSQLPSLAKRVLWTKNEEQLLVAEANSTAFTTFQALLEKNREKFHSSRTPKSLEAHFYRMKKAAQAQQQQPNPSDSSPSVNNNSTINTNLMDVDKEISNEPMGSKSELDATVLAKKKEYEKMEGQQQDAILKLEKDIQTNEGYAVIRSINQRFVMKSKEIVIGKSIPGSTVEFDLSLEQGNTIRVSRRQALIRLQDDGQFFIKNIGKNHIFVNGKLVGTLQKKRLHNHALIEISDISLLFVKTKGPAQEPSAEK